MISGKLRPIGLLSLVLAVHALLLAMPAGADFATYQVDLATVSTASDSFLRVSGSNNRGNLGVPVAGGFDCDEDGFPDVAMGSFQANVCEDPNAGCADPSLERFKAGEVHLVFGTGQITGSVDTASLPASAPANRLLIAGDVDREAAGSEVWMDDVTGDGVGDLLIARQNFTPDAGRIGAGALTILVGGPEVRTYANTLQVLDLRAPPVSLTIVNIIGATVQDRVGIWMRTGDITGDGIADIAVGVDQESAPGETHSGAVYVIRGGSHLAATQTVDLANFPALAGGTVLVGNIAKVIPPAGASEYHFGATVTVGDLDDNARSEVIVAAALNRAGAGFGPQGAPGPTHATGGTTDGTVYIAWDDNFPAGVWSAGYEIDLAMPPGTRSIIDGANRFKSFGEELLAGLDYDADGAADLFVGDLVSFVSGAGSAAGRGLVIYDAATLKGLVFDLETPPMGLVTSEFLGGGANHIAADTAMQGDFDGDGFDDLAFSSPHASPLGRIEAGAIHIFHGQSGFWPATIDLAPGALPPENQVRVTEIYGALGQTQFDSGDVLCYSGAAGDMNGDGRVDLITNEMLGNGLAPADTDVGNLIVISGALVPEPPRAAMSAAALALLMALRRMRRA